MKIDRVIFCWDGHPDFDGMYVLQRRLWRKLGVKTSIMLVGCPDIDLPDAVHLETAPELPQDPPGGRNWKATMALLHGPRLFPGEVIMTSGLDQFPMSRMFVDAIADIPDDQFVIGLGGVGGSYDKLFGGVRYYPSSHLVASFDMWMTALKCLSLNFVNSLHWAWGSRLPVMWPDHAVGWGMDEAVLGHALAVSGIRPHVLSREQFKLWDARRLGRGSNNLFGELKLAQGFYSELHANRPLPAHERAIIEKAIEIL